MNVTRRYWLKLIAFGSLFAGTAGWLSKSLSKDADQDAFSLTLKAYVDALVPPADHTPGAVELGAVDKLLQASARQARFLKLLRQGCSWLDEQAHASEAENFAALSEDDRDAVIERAAGAKTNSLEYVFFMATRDAVFVHYYSDPRSWVGLRYPGPPQPLGFMDYAEAPIRDEQRRPKL